MFTPKGLFVRVRVLRISLRRSSGVGWVRAVSYGGNKKFSGCCSLLITCYEVSGFLRSRVKTYNSQAAGVTDCCCELGVSYPLHSTLDDGHCKNQ